ncbi:diaminobutyrate--2-oxoglutarate transaminase [Sinorhizobium fredii]|uniref:diaminobutyrate--2-oxoglutarate transaminase n=2 Tax=Sinorhizobium TaxID=28105 RepID=UPI0003F582A7|nr:MULTISPECIES: diaminobutyrate--2-oxoglutarate transaminase [Sinorhizobium]WOS66942.1 diaminobutyrate--2-oxoglutarate transaminase [Sinorhizobium fredii GR64]
MVGNSQSFSLPRNVKPGVTFRTPTDNLAADVWDLIALCPQLDRNSLYCELLLCTDFADTCVVAERAGEVVGWLAAYRRPSEPSTLFIWQIAVHPKVRNTGVGKGLIISALNRPSCESVTHIKATVTLSNRASKLLFAGVARDLCAPIREALCFDRDIHFKGQHESEHTIAIGPVVRSISAAGIPAGPLSQYSNEEATMIVQNVPDREEELATFSHVESEVRSYARSFPVVFAMARGAQLFARDGTAYLDFLMGCSSLNYGHNPPELKSALADYIACDGITHGLDLYNEAKESFLREFHETILRPRQLDYVIQFPGPTGTNAVEAALKLARKITGRFNIIAFTNGFHGVSLGALSCTGNRYHRAAAGQLLGGVTRLPYDGYYGSAVDTADCLDRLVADPSSGVDAPAAVIVETVQGEGGLNVAGTAWLRKVAAIARKHGALLIVDDIQAGVGRTDAFFSFEAAGLRPDIVTMAKSISGYGLPMAIVLIDRKLDKWEPGEHNGTFRGNCHAFVTAHAALEHFWRTGSFAASVAKKGNLLKNRLDQIAQKYDPSRVSVKGRGMMQGIDLKSGELADQVTSTAFQKGLIVETAGPKDEVVKCLPPLVIGEDQLSQGLDILEEAIDIVIGNTANTAA